jgi:transcriptional regulator with XRE-family HTH domain
VSSQTRPHAQRKAAAAPNPTPVAESPEIAGSIGRVARRIREGIGLTLADVAQQAEISPGMLSRLETGRVSPSIETIVALAQALGVRPALLLQEIGDDQGGAQHVPAGQGLEVVRRGTKRGHTYHLLAAQRGPRKLFEPYLVTLTDKSEVFPGFQHPGTEYIYILSGEIRYRHGKESYLLKEGDSLTFPGDVAHGPERLIKVPIRMLSVILYAGTDSD